MHLFCVNHRYNVHFDSRQEVNGKMGVFWPSLATVNAQRWVFIIC